MVKLQRWKKVGDKVLSITDRERKREILKRGLIVKEGELQVVRKTAAKDAAFYDQRTGQRAVLRGAVHDLLYGLEKAKKDAREGNAKQQMRARKLIPLFEEMYQDQLRSARRLKGGFNTAWLNQLKEQVRNDVYNRKKLTTYDKSKIDLKKALENTSK